MNFFLLLQSAIEGGLQPWTGKAGLCYGAALTRLSDRISIVGIFIEACDATLADLHRQEGALGAEQVMQRLQDGA